VRAEGELLLADCPILFSSKTAFAAATWAHDLERDLPLPGTVTLFDNFAKLLRGELHQLTESSARGVPLLFASLRGLELGLHLPVPHVLSYKRPGSPPDAAGCCHQK